MAFYCRVRLPAGLGRSSSTPMRASQTPDSVSVASADELTPMLQRCLGSHLKRAVRWQVVEMRGAARCVGRVACLRWHSGARAYATRWADAVVHACGGGTEPRWWVAEEQPTLRAQLGDFGGIPGLPWFFFPKRTACLLFLRKGRRPSPRPAILLERLQPDWKIASVRRAAPGCCLQSICISLKMPASIERFQTG